ncbi:MAG: lipopolysaccharide biosynthesis protein [Clostridia bacterium]|nr:lipopolysaccharide biosynthesis protein [Clostridia bacterium]
MAESRGRKAASSFVFKFVESMGMQLVSFAVSLVLGNLLTPADYGVLGMLTVFIAVSQVFVQSGLNTALIQKKDVDECELSSVFYVSLGVAAALYALLYALSPVIAGYYHMPELKNALRVLALVLFPGAFISVQSAVVAREMAFRKQMLVSLAATVLSGTTGIGMALAGFGHWALVGQQLTNQFGLAILLLIVIKWRPVRSFSLSKVGTLVRFSWKLLVSSLLDTGYMNLRSAVIGKKYTQDTLGLYTRGKQFPELVMNAVNGSIQSVMLPVLSEAQDDLGRMKQMMRRSVMLSSFLVLPMMAGLAAVAEPLITLLLPDAWLPCVPFLQILAIDFAFYPIHTANLQAINAMGRSDVFLKLEIIKKSYGIAVLAVTVFCFDSVYAIAWGAVVSTFISAFVNASPNRKLLGYGYLEQMKDVLPSMALAGVMFLVVNAMNALSWPAAILLVVEIIVGAAVYAGLALLLKLESAGFLLDALRSLKDRLHA